MSEMLESLPHYLEEEDKGIKKISSEKPSQNHCVQLIAVVMDNQKVQRLNSINWNFRVYTVREVVDGL